MHRTEVCVVRKGRLASWAALHLTSQKLGRTHLNEIPSPSATLHTHELIEMRVAILGLGTICGRRSVGRDGGILNPDGELLRRRSWLAGFAETREELRIRRCGILGLLRLTPLSHVHVVSVAFVPSRSGVRSHGYPSLTLRYFPKSAMNTRDESGSQREELLDQGSTEPTRQPAACVTRDRRCRRR